MNCISLTRKNVGRENRYLRAENQDIAVPLIEMFLTYDSMILKEKGKENVLRDHELHLLLLQFFSLKIRNYTLFFSFFLNH